MQEIAEHELEKLAGFLSEVSSNENELTGDAIHIHSESVVIDDNESSGKMTELGFEDNHIISSGDKDS